MRLAHCTINFYVDTVSTYIKNEPIVSAMTKRLFEDVNGAKITGVDLSYTSATDENLQWLSQQPIESIGMYLIV